MCHYSQKLPDNAFLTIRLEYQNLFKMTFGTLGSRIVSLSIPGGTKHLIPVILIQIVSHCFRERRRKSTL